jgi:hypothetical protein
MLARRNGGVDLGEAEQAYLVRTSGSEAYKRAPQSCQSTKASLARVSGGLTARDAVPDRFGLLLRVKVGKRLPQHLLDSIKTAANARDVPYQSLIKVWLQEKLPGS